MKFRFCTLLAFSMALGAFTSVRADDAKGLETAYYPLTVGSTWHYKVAQAKIEMKVAKHEEIDKQLCARLETSVNGNVVASEHVGVKADGVYRFMMVNDKVTPPLKFIAIPAAKDQTWNVDSTAGAEKVTGTFKSGMVDEVTVPAGTYKNVYTSTGDVTVGAIKISFTYYLAKDVGMIKQTIKMPTQEIVIELEKFEAGK